MADKRSRALAKKMKDKWRAKRWYNVIAPPMFQNVGIGQTLADQPEKIVGRKMIVTLSDLTNDASKSHIKLIFRITEVDGNRAYTEYIGHEMSKDYTIRLVRRKRSKIDLINDVATRDGRILRLKIMAVTDRRIQSSQKNAIRYTMANQVREYAAKSSFGDLVRVVIDGTLATSIYKHCKKIYPLKAVEIRKSEVIGRLEGFEEEVEVGVGEEEAQESIESEKDKVIKELTTIPGIGPSKAEALYEAGIKSIDALKTIPVNELGKIDKIGPNMAHKIKEYLKTAGNTEKI